MGTNYYDPWLFDRAEVALEIDAYRGQPYLYTNLPTTTYAEYKTAVAAAYDSAPPLAQTLINFHLSALTEIVASGVTTDPDYWSAGTVDGNYIINSGITHAKVGINTIVPNHELSVSGTVSASSSLYASTLYSGTTDISTLIAAAGAGGGSTDVYWSAGTVDGNYIINSGITHAKVGINTIVPNHELSVSGSVSASTAVYVGDGSGILSGLTYHAPNYSSDYFNSYTGAQSEYYGYFAGANHSSNDQFNVGIGWKAMGYRSYEWKCN